MTAVLYQPATGDIIQTIEGSEANIAATATALGCAWCEVDQGGADLDVTHRVVNDQLVARA